MDRWLLSSSKMFLKRHVGKGVEFTKPFILLPLYPLQITDSHFMKYGVLKHIGDIFIHYEWKTNSQS